MIFICWMLVIFIRRITEALNMLYAINATVAAAEAPYTPRGCVAQAGNVAEVMRSWVNTD